MVCCGWWIKVMLIINLCGSDIILITVYDVNYCEKKEVKMPNINYIEWFKKTSCFKVVMRGRNIC